MTMTQVRRFHPVMRTIVAVVAMVPLLPSALMVIRKRQREQLVGNLCAMTVKRSKMTMMLQRSAEEKVDTNDRKGEGERQVKTTVMKIDIAAARSTVLEEMKGSIVEDVAVQIAKMAPQEEKTPRVHQVKNLKEIKRVVEVVIKSDAHALVPLKAQLKGEEEIKMKMIGMEDALHATNDDTAATQAIAAIKINKEMKPTNSTRRKRRKSR